MMMHRSLLVDAIKTAQNYGWHAFRPSRKYIRAAADEVSKYGNTWWTLMLMLDALTVVGVALITALSVYELWWLQLLLGAVWFWHLHKAWYTTKPLPYE